MTIGNCTPMKKQPMPAKIAAQDRVQRRLDKKPAATVRLGEQAHGAVAHGVSVEHEVEGDDQNEQHVGDEGDRAGHDPECVAEVAENGAARSLRRFDGLLTQPSRTDAMLTEELLNAARLTVGVEVRREALNDLLYLRH